MSGTPLDGETRGFMESRFGHNFSDVRVHTDAAAARSAQAFDAAAYTVGSHIVFGAKQYSPHSSAGRRLLAHELAHVVQQGGSGRHEVMQRASIGVAPEAEDEEDVAVEDETLEREAEEAADSVVGGGRAWVAAAGPQRLQRQRGGYHPEEVSDELYYEAREPNLAQERDIRLAECLKAAGPNPEQCTPATALKWADFRGTPQANEFSAWTEAPVTDVAMDPVRAGCLQRIMGASADQTRVFKAVLDPAKSWVRPQFTDPTNAKVNGCGAVVDDCKRYFDTTKKQKPTYSLNSKPRPRCPAYVPPAPATATSKDTCQSALEPPCTAAALSESARLLRHEQGHFGVACAIARHATAALEAGSGLSTLRTGTRKKRIETQRAYDNDSKHGCNASQQASWETDIAAGLPTVTIP